MSSFETSGNFVPEQPSQADYQTAWHRFAAVIDQHHIKRLYLSEETPAFEGRHVYSYEAPLPLDVGRDLFMLDQDIEMEDVTMSLVTPTVLEPGASWFYTTVGIDVFALLPYPIDGKVCVANLAMTIEYSYDMETNDESYDGYRTVLYVVRAEDGQEYLPDEVDEGIIVRKFGYAMTVHTAMTETELVRMCTTIFDYEDESS